MNTNKIIKALESADFMNCWNRNAIEYNKEFKRKYDCTLDDYFDILEEKTPFTFKQIPRKNGKGFHHNPYICLK